MTNKTRTVGTIVAAFGAVAVFGALTGNAYAQDVTYSEEQLHQLTEDLHQQLTIKLAQPTPQVLARIAELEATPFAGFDVEIGVAEVEEYTPEVTFTYTVAALEKE